MFFEHVPGVYSIDDLDTDQDLMDRLNSGKGPLMPPQSTDYINIQVLFGGTTPSKVDQDVSGVNNMSRAEALALRYLFISQANLDDGDMYSYDEDLEDWVDDFNDDAEYIKVYAYTSTALERGFQGNLGDDLILIQIGIALLICYSVFVLSSAHPIRSRAALAMAGVGSVMLAYIEALGFGTYMGF